MNALVWDPWADILKAVQSLAARFDVASGSVALKPGKEVTGAELQGLLAGLVGARPVPDLPFAKARLTRFTAQKGTKLRPTLFEISVNFGKSATLEICDGVSLSLKGGALTYMAGAWSGAVVGSVTVEGHEFSVEMDYPSMILRGALAKPKTASLKRVVARQGLTLGAKPTLSALELYVAGRTKRIEIYIAAEHLIKIGKAELSKVDLLFLYPGGVQAQAEGRFHAELAIALKKKTTLTLGILAEKSANGWKLEASAQASAPLHDLVGAMSRTLFGASHKLDQIIPPDLARAKVTGTLGLRYEPQNSHATLTATVVVKGRGRFEFSIDMAEAGLTVKARLILDKLSFEVDFEKTGTGNLIFVGQFASEAGVTLKLADLLKGHAGQGAKIDLEITLRDALVAAEHKAGKAGKEAQNLFLLAADIDGGIDLSGFGSLPLVGKMLPREARLVLSLAPVLPVGAWGAEDITALNALRGTKGPTLPETLSAPMLRASLKLTGQAPKSLAQLALPLGDVGATGKGSAVAPAPSPANTPAINWTDVQKRFGPVQISKIGFGLDKSKPNDPKLEVLMSGALAFGGLEFDLQGLGASYHTKTRKLDFELDGLGLSFSKPPVTIAGGFARIRGKKGADYVGKVAVGMKQFSLTASGGFAMLGDTPSFFLYGVLNTPLGGPPFFFVEGLAAGFGLNRDLIAPSLATVRNFPLVVDAVGVSRGAGAKTPAPSFMDQLARLHDVVQPQLGQYFLAAGVKFTSFELLNSFVLVSLGFGREFKIDVIGVSTYQTPPKVPDGLPAMARVELNLRGAVRPSQGSVIVEAELGQNSYVYAPVCKLGGGFAFAAWFGGPHKGDFVLSVGGYHPRFNLAAHAHYPRPKRISLTYQITDKIFVKGEAYFALTPTAFMAGGGLHAHAEVSGASADFRLEANFIVSWEPYYYDAEISVSIRVKYGPFHTSASADLHVWGPDFSGKASVHWWFLSFHVSFGAGAPKAPPITWAAFEDKFLPPVKAAKGMRLAPAVTVSAGQIGTAPAKAKGADPRPVLSPTKAELAVSSFVPVQTVNLDGKAPAKPLRKVSFGVAPMNLAAVKSSDLTMALHHEEGGAGKAPFELHPAKEAKSFPSALWGSRMTPDLNDKPISAPGDFVLRLVDHVEVPQTASGRPALVRKTMEAALFDEHALRSLPDAPGALLPDSPSRAPMPGAGKRRAMVLTSLGLDPVTSPKGEALRKTLAPHDEKAG